MRICNPATCTVSRLLGTERFLLNFSFFFEARCIFPLVLSSVKCSLCVVQWFQFFSSIYSQYKSAHFSFFQILLYVQYGTTRSETYEMLCIYYFAPFFNIFIGSLYVIFIHCSVVYLPLKYFHENTIFEEAYVCVRGAWWIA